jgi:hypothetical protein
MEIGSWVGCVSFLEKYASKRQDRLDYPPGVPQREQAAKGMWKDPQRHSHENASSSGDPKGLFSDFLERSRDSRSNPAGKSGKAFLIREKIQAGRRSKKGENDE